jgi:hypothetical protein
LSRGADMTTALWMLVGLFVLVAYILIFALMKVSHKADREARRLEKRMDPFSDVYVTITGPGR